MMEAAFKILRETEFIPTLNEIRKAQDAGTMTKQSEHTITAHLSVYI